MKKYLSLIIILFFSGNMCANMASPILEGNTPASAFTNSFAYILHEDILIRPSADFKSTTYTVAYDILTDKDGKQVPLLFYAPHYKGNFKVWIDGRRVTLYDLPEDITLPNNAGYNDLMGFYEQRPWNGSDSRYAEFSTGTAQEDITISLHDLVYFTSDLTKGMHKIKIIYEAENWTDTWDRVNEYYMVYALGPARYWKSFGSLTITLDCNNINGKITSNLGKPQKGSLENGLATWNFTALPVELLTIKYKPNIPVVASAIQFVTPYVLTLITLLTLIFWHMRLLYLAHKSGNEKRRKWVLYSGALLIPVLFPIMYILMSYVEIWAIGQHANSRGMGYTALLFMLYPALFVIYLISVLVINFFMRLYLDRDK